MIPGVDIFHLSLEASFKYLSMKKKYNYIYLFLILYPSITAAMQCDWLGTVDDNWSNPANWSCGSVPDLNDTVTVDNLNVILDIDAEARMVILKGNGTISGSKNLNIVDQFHWQGSATLGDGSGGIVTVAGKISIEDHTTKNLNGKDLILNGGGTYDGGQLILSLAKIEIGHDRTLHLIHQDYSGILSFDNSTFVNNGTLHKTAVGNALTEFDLNVQNNDSIIYESGQLRLRNCISVDAVIEITGTLFIASNTFFDTKISGGVIRVEGTCTVESGTTLNSRIDVINGTFLNNTSLTLEQPFNLRLSGGSVIGIYKGGPGSQLILNGRSSWAGLSKMEGEGNIEVNDTFSILGTVNRFTHLSELSLALNGVTYWKSDEIAISGTTQILNTGELHVQGSSDQIINQEGGTPTIINSGTIQLDSNYTMTSELDIINDGWIQGIGTLNFPNRAINGSGTINPGLSTGILSVDGNTIITSGFEFEIEDGSGPGLGHDLLKVYGQIDINQAFSQFSGSMNITDGHYTILECQNGPGCYTGTFETSYLPTGLRLDFLPDRINLVKGPHCIDTWKVDAEYLSNDPHNSIFQSYNQIISNGLLTDGEDIVFDAPGAIILQKGFAVEANASLEIKLNGCEE